VKGYNPMPMETESCFSDCTLVIMAKAPQPGVLKTRLCACPRVGPTWLEAQNSLNKVWLADYGVFVARRNGRFGGSKAAGRRTNATRRVKRRFGRILLAGRCPKWTFQFKL
jgi:hypothetical protein